MSLRNLIESSLELVRSTEIDEALMKLITKLYNISSEIRTEAAIREVEESETHTEQTTPVSERTDIVQQVHSYHGEIYTELTGGRWFCEWCNKVFKNNDDYQRHLRYSMSHYM